MSPKLQKISLFVILGLLVIFVPLTIYSYYLKTENREKSNKELINESKELFYNGKLWFYNEKKELLGTYECEHTYCDIGVSYENDAEYAIDAYIPEEQVKLPIINEQFVFIKDVEEENSHSLFLHDIKNNISFKAKMYNSVKNYQIGLQDNLFIVEDINHLYGVLGIEDLAIQKIKNDYSFLGVANLGIENNELISDFFVAEKNGNWSILDAKEGGELAHNLKEQIVTFTGEYIITKDSLMKYHLYDYDNNKLLEEDFENLSFVGKYLACRANTEFYLYDLKNQTTISGSHRVTSRDTIYAEVNSDNEIVITKNGKIEETIAL